MTKKSKKAPKTGQTVPVLDVTGNLYFRQALGEGKIDGVNFDLAAVIGGGSIHVTFRDKGKVRHSFLVDSSDVVHAAYEAYKVKKRLGQ